MTGIRELSQWHKSTIRTSALIAHQALLRATVIAAGLLAAGNPAWSVAEERSAAQLLPASTVFYVELTQPKQLMTTLLEHPLRQRIEALDNVQKQLQSEPYRQVQGAVKLLEVTLGMSWRVAVETLTSGGIYGGFDAQSQGAVVLLKASDPAKLTEIRDKLIALARADAQRRGAGDPIRHKEYRGLVAFEGGNGVAAQLGGWLLITNKNELAKSIADAYLDGRENSLAADANFRAARARIAGQPTAWGYWNVAALRDAGLAKELFREKSDNPAAELLLGGALSTLGKTPYATLEFTVERSNLRLALAMPHDATWIPERRQYFFGPDGKGAAGVPLRPKQTVFSMESFRDVGQYWLAKEELFEENVVAQLAQADSQFSTLFSGLNFGQEVLSAIAPQTQFVLARQDYEGLGLPAPDVKLPAGAYIYRLKDREKMARRLKVVFQSLIGLTNYGLAQQGQPQFDLETETRGAAQIVSATYIAEDGAAGNGAAGLIHYNFSPTIAFSGDWFIVSSTKTLACELAELAAQAEQPAEAHDLRANTRAALDVQVLANILEDNRKHLVAQNALENGHSKEEAEKEIGTLLDLLKAGQDVRFRLSTGGDVLSLEWQLKTVE